MSTAIKPPMPAEGGSPSRHIMPPKRLGSRWLNYLRALLGTPSQRRLARGGLQIDAIRWWEKRHAKLSDDELRRQALLLRGRARSGEALDRLLPEFFGLGCVACWRHLRLEPFDVQLGAGVVLHQGGLAEVATGEGKTLIAILPAALNALVGKGVHVTTVNDYLARRDCELTAPVHAALGLSVGMLQAKLSDEARMAAYRADITYGTSSELGFDFLRDRLKVKSQGAQATPFWHPWTSQGTYLAPPDPKSQRGHHYALVDEADNIFVDEARTPLIIGAPTRLAREEEQVVYRWADKLARAMVRDEHFFLDEKKSKVELTDLGRTMVRYSNPPFGPHSHAMDKLHEHMERAIQANHRYRRDQHYMIDADKKVVIIDEFTGRPMPDRHWQEGLHQAVEAKEDVPITTAGDHVAQITYQSYFRLYTKLSGMTGTAAQNWWELFRVYKLWVVCVPTNRRCLRRNLPDRVFPTEDAKFDAIVDSVRAMRAADRPVLIGTRSVDKSEKLSQRLTAAGIDHHVLNARPDKHDKEAEIVAQAGRRGAITISTNMAGRGTDILLGGNPEFLAWDRLKEKYATRLDVPAEVWRATVHEIEVQEKILEERQHVQKAGGLHVIGTERHEARRIDRQLVGRAARQGDPGSCQFFLSLEDELLEGLGADYQAALIKIGQKGGAGSWDKYLPLFYQAQKKLESRHYRQRVDLMNYQRQRHEILKELSADPYVD